MTNLLRVVAATFLLTATAHADDELLGRYGSQAWQRDVEGPVLSLGEAGAFDDTHLLSPCVARVDGRYLMWYVGSRGKVADRVYRLGLAVSDDGKTFTKYEANPVLEFADGKRSIVTPTLLATNDGRPIREDGKLRMWFTGTDFRDPTQLHTLHEATSPDGVTWSSPSEAQLNDVYAPTIIKEDDGYRLWYTDVSKLPWCFRHATSPDGRTWDVDAEPTLTIGQEWEAGRLFYPAVRIPTVGVALHDERESDATFRRLVAHLVRLPNEAAVHSQVLRHRHGRLAGGESGSASRLIQFYCPPAGHVLD
jgi:hypothetical protein